MAIGDPGAYGELARSLGGVFGRGRDWFRATVGIDSSTHGGVLCRRGSDLLCMRQGELCHDRFMDLLLAECMQDIGAARLDAKTRCAGIGLKPGV